MGASRVERGTTLQGEYVLLECIGEQTGLVFRAQRRRDGAAVIARVFAGLGAQDGETLLELAGRARRVRHPALAAVLACGRNQGDVFVVEELVAGRSMSEACERGGIPPLARAVELVLQLSRALESAHRHGVAHDALGPRNVLLCGSADAPQVKLVDLGVPGFVRAWPPPLPSAQYMAPEQLAPLRFARTRLGADAVMNVYSLGALLYDLCTGGPPFVGSSCDELIEAHATQRVMPPSRINPQIPSTLDTVLLRALSVDPAQRFAGARDLIEALSGLRLTTGVSGVQPVAVLPSSERPSAPAKPPGATWHGGFEERPTAKVELPPLPPSHGAAQAPRGGAASDVPPAPPVRRSVPPTAESKPPTAVPAVPTAAPAAVGRAPQRSTPPLGAFSGGGEVQTPVPLPLPPRLRVPRRVARAALLTACGVMVALFWLALRLPQPVEQVRSIRLEPEPLRSERARTHGVDPARVAVPQPPEANAGGRAAEPEPLPRIESEPRPSPRAARRSARSAEPRAREAERGPSERPPHVEPPAEERANPFGDSELAANEASPLPRSARESSTAQPARSAVGTGDDPSDAATAAPSGARPSRPAAAAVPAANASTASTKPRASQPPRARISELQVRGSLPSSLVEQAIARVIPQLNECLRKAASAGARPSRLQVALELDEQGRARAPRVRGASTPGLSACVAAAAARIASRRVPDTGTVAASFSLEVAP